MAIKTAEMKVFIDGAQINARSMSSNGKYMTLDADSLPTDGRHLVRVVSADDSNAIEVDCEVLFEFNDWAGTWESRFYLTEKPKLKQLDNQAIVL